jgi:hypothetical protein
MRTHIQSMRASFSRAVPGGVGTRKQKKMRVAAVPQTGMLRSVWMYKSERSQMTIKPSFDAQNSHRHCPSEASPPAMMGPTPLKADQAL